MVKLTKHHRKCKSWKMGSKATKEDVSMVKENAHTHWHGIFANMHPWTICRLINEYWIDSDFEFICRKKSYKDR